MTVITEPETAKPCIPDSDVLYTLRRIVDKYGSDYVYKGEDKAARCVYYEDGKPSCLVGQLLARLTPDYQPGEVGVMTQRHDLHDIGYSKNATYALQVAQTLQDRRHTWGAALVAAGVIMEFAPEFW